ncbi:MAG: hypothetical protein R2685_10025 [Candidatus Nitrosocosmicus sp.]|nr:hypothetical protein [Candidatus Nitrosocosmicus sp.]
MNNFHILAIVAIVTVSSLFAGMVVPAVAQGDNMTMGMDNSSMGMNQMDNSSMGMNQMDNSSMGMNQMDNSSMGMN